MVDLTYPARAARAGRESNAVTAEVAVAAMLTVALEEARQGLAEGGILIGAALFGPDGELLGAATTVATAV